MDRDDFSKKTKLNLAQRAGYICSNPDCNRLTIGPSIETSDKVLLIGVAAHIEAASHGGPRYNINQTKAERASIENGIWLCASDADFIDEDVEKYPVKKLKEWKKKHEEKIYNKLIGLPDPSLNVYFDASQRYYDRLTSEGRRFRM